MATIAGLKARLTADVGEFVAGMGAANSSLGDFMTRSTLVGTGLAAVGVAAVLVGRQAFEMGQAYDDALDTIQIATGATGTELEALGSIAREIFRTIPTDLHSAAEAVGYLNTRLGLTGGTLSTVSQQILELSRITGTDLQGNMTAAADAMAKWNVAAQDIPSVLDMIFRASQASGASFARLAELVTTNAAVFQQFGFTLPEAIALLASLEKAGVNTEQAMMGLKFALSKFAEEGVTDAKTALEDLFTRIKNAPTDIEATAIAVEYFGKRAGPELATAIRTGRLDLEGMLGVVQGGESTILGTAAATNDFAEKWQILKNNLNDALIPLGTLLFSALNALLPLLTAAVQGLVALTSAFGNLPGPINEVFGVMMGIAKAQLMSLPMLLDAAKAALERLKAGFDTARTGVEGFVQAIGQKLSEAGVAFTMFKDAAIAAVSSMATSVVSKVSLMLSDVKTFVTSMKDAVVAQFTLAKTNATTIADAIKTYVTQAFNTLSSSVYTHVTNIANNIKKAFDTAKTSVGTAMSGLASTVISTLIGLVASAYSMAQSVGSAIISGMVSGVMSMVGSLISSVVNAVTSAVDAAKAKLGIGSPSKVFRQIGIYSGQGLVLGLGSMESRVSAAGESLAAASVNAFGSSLNGDVSSGSGTGGNAQPAIVVVQSLRSDEWERVISDVGVASDFARGFGQQLGLYGGTP